MMRASCIAGLSLTVLRFREIVGQSAEDDCSLSEDLTSPQRHASGRIQHWRDGDILRLPASLFRCASIGLASAAQKSLGRLHRSRLSHHAAYAKFEARTTSSHD